MARSLGISCLETAVEVEALILWCSRGMGGNIWEPAAFPWCPEHPASPKDQEHPRF